MKIVIFNGKHKLDLDHEVLYFDFSDRIKEDGDNGDQDIVSQIVKFKPDLIIEEEKNNGADIFTEVYKALPEIPKAYWCIDAHTNLIDHIVYAKQFTYVFCAQSWFIPILRHEILGELFYLPLCHTQTLTEYTEMLSISDMKRDIKFSFIGNLRSIHVDRKKYVAKFLEIYPEFFAHQADYKTTLDYLRRSKSTFNCSLNNDLNFRVWEAIACGANVITDYVTDIDKLTSLREYISTYDKLSPNWQKMNFPSEYNTNKNEEFIKNTHTLTHRMNQMIEMIERGYQYKY